MKHIAIFQKDLGVGGIQKSLINILSVIDDVEVDLYLFDRNIFYDITEILKKKNINIKYLEPLPNYSKYMMFDFIVKKYKNKYKIDKAYDLAIDFNSYCNETALLTKVVKATEKICFLHSDLEQKLIYEKRYRISKLLSQKKFQYYDKFIFVSKGIVEGFYKTFPFSKHNYQIIPNLVDTSAIKEQAKLSSKLIIDENNYNLITVARLEYVKGIDILINNFKEIINKNQNVHLYIVGDGSEKNNLISQVKKLRLDNYITFLGKTNNPYNIMNVMDGFILLSRYEGQGITILEALSLGLDIFIPKHLEKYCVNVSGVDDIIDSVSNATKNRLKKFDDLELYNKNILDELNKLFRE